CDALIFDRILAPALGLGHVCRQQIVFPVNLNPMAGKVHQHQIVPSHFGGKIGNGDVQVPAVGVGELGHLKAQPLQGLTHGGCVAHRLFQL
uniref:Uncharacterized protein n=1 Tax=Hippocampus comes TaxID=109280 RepID=A0A3Q3DC70_HIPCM